MKFVDCKHSFALVIAAIFLLSYANVAFAQVQLPGPGITPDNFLYAIDVAFDRLLLLLTFDKTEKAKKGLEIARERLAEVRAMIEQNKLEAAERAEREHFNFLSDVESAVADIRRANATEEVQDVIEVEKMLVEYDAEVENLSNELKVKIEIKGNITAEQKALIDSILSFMQNKTGEVIINIDAKKREAKIKIKQETGKSDEEVEEAMKNIEERKGVKELLKEKALDRINETETEIAELEALLSEVAGAVNATSVNVLLSEAKEKLTIAEKAFEEERFGEAFGQATAAERLADNASRILEKLLGIEVAPIPEVEVDIEKSVAEVKVKAGREKFEFVLNTTELVEIKRAVAELTGLTAEQVEAHIKIEKERPGEIGEGIKPQLRERMKNIAAVPVSTPEKIVPEKQIETQTQEFTIEADDFGFYADGNEITSVSVSKGSKVIITFKVRSAGVYYGGLDFRGCGQTSRTARPGSFAEAVFDAESNCIITSYWPASGIPKARLQVVVS